jgi:hypothetical protein
MARAGDADSGPARAVDTIVLGGLAAGILDILDAFIVTTMTGGTSARVLQAIASGVLGREAYQGGAAVAALGLALHFVIAFGAAATFFVISRLFPVVLRYAVWSGIAFGLGVWVFMYYGVLPITFNRPHVLPAWPQLLNQLGIHALGVGLPIALIARRSARLGAGAIGSIETTTSGSSRKATASLT